MFINSSDYISFKDGFDRSYNPINEVNRINTELSKTGVFDLEGIDYDVLIFHAFNYKISPDELREKISGRYSITTMEKRVQLLLNCGFKIISKRIDGFNYYISGMRT